MGFDFDDALQAFSERFRELPPAEQERVRAEFAEARRQMEARTKATKNGATPAGAVDRPGG